eukprot:3770890-Pleurochrysis_carterae.AAC.1
MCIRDSLSTQRVASAKRASAAVWTSCARTQALSVRSRVRLSLVCMRACASVRCVRWYGCVGAWVRASLCVVVRACDGACACVNDDCACAQCVDEDVGL